MQKQEINLCFASLRIISFPETRSPYCSLCSENFMLLKLILIFICWRSYCLCCRLEEFLSVRRDCGRLVGRWEKQNFTITWDTSRYTHSLPLLCTRDRRIDVGQFGFSFEVDPAEFYIGSERPVHCVVVRERRLPFITEVTPGQIIETSLSSSR